MNNVIKLLIEWRNMPLAVYGILILKAFSWLKQITFRMERSSGISKAGTIRPSLWVTFCKDGHPICRSLAVPENGWMMVVSWVNSIYPITSDFCGSTFGGHLSCQELGSQWPQSALLSFLNLCQDLTYHVSVHPHLKHWQVLWLKIVLRALVESSSLHWVSFHRFLIWGWGRGLLNFTMILVLFSYFL